MAEGRGDFSGGEDGKGDLVEQRLEGVVVFAVDQRDVDRLIREAFGGVETAETASDNDHFRLFACVLKGVSIHSV